mmetsp:Transcript_3676/g.6578  ORF Transcript_3676/g.6578 Transcript_3676/m.6578 type:complete len:210 (+) Transcript_3676:1380-2009(+)
MSSLSSSSSSEPSSSLSSGVSSSSIALISLHMCVRMLICIIMSRSMRYGCPRASNSTERLPSSSARRINSCVWLSMRTQLPRSIHHTRRFLAAGVSASVVSSPAGGASSHGLPPSLESQILLFESKPSSAFSACTPGSGAFSRGIWFEAASETIQEDISLLSAWGTLLESSITTFGGSSLAKLGSSQSGSCSGFTRTDAHAMLAIHVQV